MGVQERRNRDLWAVEDSVEELSELAKTANAFVVGSMVQKRERPTRAYLGKGKLEELKSIVKSQRINTIIFDDELTPTQQRNLERKSAHNTRFRSDQ